MYRPCVLPTVLYLQGLGKTIELLGLILSNPEPPSVISGRRPPHAYCTVVPPCVPTKCTAHVYLQGLGKTIEVLGLILSNPAPPSVKSGRYDPEAGRIISRGTLVVCAVSLVGQVGADTSIDGW